MKAADNLVALAEADAAAARTDFIATLGELRHRLAPRTIFTDSATAARDRVVDLAGDAGAAIKARPLAVGGGVGAVLTAAVVGLVLRRRRRAKDS